MQKTRGTALLAASLLLMGGLSACGDEGSGADESSSTTASPSAPEKTSSPEDSSTSEASEGSESSGSSDSSDSSDSAEESAGDEVAELPAAAKKQTKAGAIAFNEFYQDELGKSLKSGNTATIEKYTFECNACDAFNEKTKANRSKGITMDRNPYSTRDLSATPRTDSGMKVSMTVESSGYREVHQDGSKGRSAEPTSYKLISDTQWRGGHWVIHDTVIVK